MVWLPWFKKFSATEFRKVGAGRRLFSGVTLTSDSYGELLANIAALNQVTDVEFDGGLSKAQGLIGIQAREKLIQKLGWQMIDGDSPKPVPKDARPAEIQPKPEAVNDF